MTKRNSEDGPKETNLSNNAHKMKEAGSNDDDNSCSAAEMSETPPEQQLSGRRTNIGRKGKGRSRSSAEMGFFLSKNNLLVKETITE